MMDNGDGSGSRQCDSGPRFTDPENRTEYLYARNTEHVSKDTEPLCRCHWHRLETLKLTLCSLSLRCECDRRKQSSIGKLLR